LFSVFHFQQLFNVSFVCCFLFVEIIQEFKDKAIVDTHAAPSYIQGSKKKDGYIHQHQLTAKQKLQEQELI